MYVRFGADPLSVPCAGVPTVQLSASPSTSLPVSVMVTCVSSAVVMACALAMGASFTAVTTMVTVAGADVSVASFTVNVNESLPK